MTQHPAGKPTYTQYISGFFLSINLTLAAYFIVTRGLLSSLAVAAIIILALAQLFVQLYFFLHLGAEKGPRWQLGAFGFMALMVIILVLGTLWVMQNLDYNMHPKDAETKLLDKYDEGGI
ncbi:MAG: cytochrome o ubiquinol oxidase subunit IV [Candidatus Saccharimonadales bacterium]